jgi:hypothetical protein
MPSSVGLAPSSPDLWREFYGTTHQLVELAYEDENLIAYWLVGDKLVVFGPPQVAQEHTQVNYPFCRKRSVKQGPHLAMD